MFWLLWQQGLKGLFEIFNFLPRLYTDGQIDRQKQEYRWTDSGQADKRQMDRQEDKETERKTKAVKNMDGQGADRQKKDRWTDRRTKKDKVDGQAGRQKTDGQIEGQINRQRQADNQMDGQTYMHVEIKKLSICT